jgi:general secretion pathway protein K
MARTAERGSILISVLALAILLAFLAAIATAVVRAAHGSGRAFADDIRAEHAARAVLEKLVAENPDPRTAVGSALVLPGLAAEVLMSNEAGRIDLNTAPPELIAGVFRALRMEEDFAATLAARIVDFRDEDDKVSQNGGAERDAYRAQGRADGPANRPFAHVAELALVLGMPLQAAAAAAPYFTVASKQAGINPLVASDAVLMALPGVDAAHVADFLDARAAGDIPIDRLKARLNPAASKFLVDDFGAASRAQIVVRLGPRNIRRFEAIVAPGSEKEPYRILAWQAGAPPPPPVMRP